MLELLLAAAAAWAIGAWSIGRHFESSRRIKRILQRTPLVSLDAARDGKLQHFRGKLSGAPVTSPTSGRSCIYYRIQFEQFFRGSWKTVSTEESAGELLLGDGSHHAVVRMKGALLAIPMTEVRSPFGGEGLGGDTRMREGVIADGALVDVAALVRMEPSPSQADGYRETALRAVLQTHGRIPLFLSVT